MKIEKIYVVWQITGIRQDTEFLTQLKPFSKFGKFENAQKFTLKQAIRIKNSFKKDSSIYSQIRYGYDRI